MLDYNMIEEAHERIKDKIYETPLEKSLFLSNDTRNVFMKLECQQKIVKSFKLRGALSKMTTLTDAEKERGVTTISSGNNGVAVSYGAKLMGIEKCNIYVPENAPTAKLDKMKKFDARVKRVGKNFDEAHKIGEEAIKRDGLTEIHPCEDPIAVAGQGTIAIEILKQNPDIDQILVPIGGGGLISGIALAAKSIKPDIIVTGIQTEACPAMLKAIEDDVCYEYFESEESICEALIGGVNVLPFNIIKEGYVDSILIVKEKYIRQAVREMAIKEKVIAEPSSTIVYGAIIEHGEKLEGKNIAIIISGGNIGDELFINILNERENENV